MLKQILSVSDVEKLQIGDRIFDNPEFSLAKSYTVQNISENMIYAIYENGHRELKMLKVDEIPHTTWWIIRE